MNYKDLRKKTILDFTSDAEIIEELIGDPKLFIENLTEQSRALSFIYYAERINNKKMIEAVEKEFSDELPKFFNE
mgnify:FL=1